MASRGVERGGRPPLARSVATVGPSGRLLGSSSGMDQAHDCAHDQVRVGSGPLWVVDLAGLPAGLVRAVQVTASGCWRVAVPLDRPVPVPVEACGPRRPGYLGARPPLALVPVPAEDPSSALTVPLNVSAFGQ